MVQFWPRFLVGCALISFSLAASLPDSLSLVARAEPTICPQLPTKWSYKGCYSDNPGSRVLGVSNYHDDAGMDEVKCISYCDSKGFSWAGVEYGKECWCGYTLASSAQSLSESSCNMACSGDKTQKCGGAGSLNAFSNGDAAPHRNYGPPAWSWQSCLKDSVYARTLNKQINLKANSVTACTAACADYAYAGVEYGSECFCGDDITNWDYANPDECNMVCSGDKTEWCGGAARIDVYWQDPNLDFEVKTRDGKVASWSFIDPNNAFKTEQSTAAYDGNYAYAITALKASQTGTLQTKLHNLQSGGQYSVTVYQGRVSGTSQPYEQQGVSIAINGNVQAYRNACSGTDYRYGIQGYPPCEQSGRGGSQYQNFGTIFSASASTMTLGILVNTNTNQGTVLIDHILVQRVG